MTSNNQIFTGGDNLTGSEKLIHNAMMLNELSGGYGGYELSNAIIGNSGYSFGGNQMDLSANPASRPIFEDIITNATDTNGVKFLTTSEVSGIMSIVSSDTATLTQTQIDKINSSLSSSYGVTEINAAYVHDISQISQRVNSAISTVTNTSYQAFLNTDRAKMILADYHNQFDLSPNGQMERFIRGESVTVNGETIQIEGTLDEGDLLNFILTTKHGTENVNDVIRRQNNIQEAYKQENPNAELKVFENRLDLERFIEEMGENPDNVILYKYEKLAYVYTESETLNLDHENYLLGELIDSAVNAAEAVAEFISKQTAAGVEWLTSQESQLLLAQWFSENIADIIDGNLSADDAFISLAANDNTPHAQMKEVG